MRRAVLLSSVLLSVLSALSVVSAQDSARTLALVPQSGPLKGKAVYAKSHALLVGVNRYPGMPGKDLQFALNDVRDLADILVKNYGFRPENVKLLTDSHATLAGIKAALVELADSRKVGAEDRVLVYFSGHGQTVKLGAGGEMGFLIPHDAKVDLDDSQNAAPYLGSCLPMSQLWDYLGPSSAKHILVIADACYSGLLAQARGRERISEDTLAQLAVTRARQVMTAGQKGQVSYEMAQVGHGAFTAKMLERLRARAADDDVFTAAELHADVQIAVSNLSKGKQQPVIGSYETEGQFLFIPVAYTGPQFSAQSLIGSSKPAEPSVAPEIKKNTSSPQTQSPGTKSSAKFGSLEIHLPAGWAFDDESNRTAGLYKPELKDAGDPNQYLKFYLRDLTSAFRHRPSTSWFDYAKMEIDGMLRNKQLIVEDSGYSRGKTAQGLDIATRRTMYRESASKTIGWDHYGIRSGGALVMIYVKYPNKEFYKTIEPEIQQIIDGFRFAPEG